MTESGNRHIGELMIRNLDILKTDLERIPDDLLWRTFPGISNSFGNLVLHICGNLNHFVGNQIGGTDYLRDRDAEFSLQNVPSQELFDLIRDTRAMIDDVLGKKSAPYGDKTYEIAGQTFSSEHALVYLLNHQAYHTGQANYISRILANKNK
jgi:uncharacterized damage-inducible protein DinB